MTTELTKAAQQALEACPFCDGPASFCASERGWTAYLHAACDQCGARSPNISYSIRHNGIDPETREYLPPKDRQREVAKLWNTRALTQRPAAQTEREAFEAWARPNGYDLRRNDVLGHYSSIDTSRAWSGFRAGRASLPAPQQATPDQFADASKMVSPVALRSVRLTRDTAGMCVVRVNGRVAIRDNGDIIDHIATLEWFADTQQATPEPVRPNLPVAGYSNARGQEEPLVYLNDVLAQQATPEPVGEPVARVELMQTGGNAGLATRIVEIDDPLRERLRPGDVLYHRPAPGVPEGFALVPIKSDDAILRPFYNCPPEELGLAWDAAMRVAQVRLAAAQAKGGE